MELLLLQLTLVVFVLGRLLPFRRTRPLSASAWMVDYTFAVFNILITGLAAGLVVAGLKKSVFAYFPALNLNLWDHRPVAVQVLVAFLVADFAAYASHRIRHKIEWLWFFHSTHHSQTMLNPFTNLRTHPCDIVLDTVLRAGPVLIVGGSYGAWFWFAVIDCLWGYFVHADVRVNLGPLKYVVVTPQYHRIHHSLEERHWNKNFAERLPIWDFLFGTLYAGFDEYPQVGIPDYPVRETCRRPLVVTSLWIALVLYPFQKLGQELRRFSVNFRDAEYDED